jgi:hypothetical protein
MKRVALTALVVCAGSSLAQSPQGSPRTPALEIPFSQLKWTSPPGTDSSAQFAMLRVDSASGSTQLLWRFRRPVKGPCEWHAASQSIVVIQGSVVVQRNGAEGSALGVGGFAFIPRNTRFQLSVLTEPTMILSTLDGRLDMNAVGAAECRG